MADSVNIDSTDACTTAAGAAGAPAGASVLDPGKLAELRSLDPNGQASLVPRVLATYQTSLARLVDQLHAARAAAHWDDVARAAHTLKSSSGSIGALAFSSLCAEIERVTRAGDLLCAQRLLARFPAEHARVVDAVAAALAAEGAPSR